MRISSLIVVVTLFWSCTQDNIIPDCDCTNSILKSCVVYEQTNCSDPWGHYDLEIEEIIDNLTVYFDELGVKLHDVFHDEFGIIQNCYGCGCTTGRRFWVKVKKSDISTMVEEGFILAE